MGIPLDLGNICGPQSPTANRQHSATAPTTPARGDDLPAVMTADEVAALLRVDRKTVYDAVKDGTLPALRLRTTDKIVASAIGGPAKTIASDG